MRKAILTLAAAATATVGAGGLLLIKEHEGLRTKTYIDPVGIPTVCYGHTGRYARRGAQYTAAKCEAILLDDIELHQRGLNRCITRKLNQNQSDAVTSFAFNVGVGAACKSTLVKKINRGDMVGAANEFPRWVYAGGRRFNGLVKRRDAERTLFLSPVAIQQPATVRFDHLK